MRKHKSKEYWYSMLVSDKIDFQAKTSTRKICSHFLMVKGSILQEDKIILSCCTSNTIAKN